MTNTIVAPKKLIEVALPLTAINKACAKEKSNHRGHPSSLHLWWARRPLAAARAVLFAQLVNDPSWRYSAAELKKPQVRSAITRKRNELFKLLIDLVQWDNVTNEELLTRARNEIRASWKETCAANAGASGPFDADALPKFHDPFAGGGAIPLEAQRLGLYAYGTDLNPVAVLINKALLELPTKYYGRTPVGPIPSKDKQTKAKAVEDWSGTKGFAEDIRRYGAWMREAAIARLGDLYPSITVSKAMAKDRADLKDLVGQRFQVLAWLWARTVASPNPAAGGTHVPLISNFFLSSKGESKVWLSPLLHSDGTYSLVIKTGAAPPSGFLKSTVSKKGGLCLLTKTAIPFPYVRSEGRAGRIGFRLLAAVIDTDHGRKYIAADQMPDEVRAAHASMPAAAERLPSVELPEKALGFRVQQYGITQWTQLFLPRQLQLLSVLGDLLAEVEKRCAAVSNPEYAAAVSTVLGLCVSKMAVFNNAIGRWRAGENKSAPAFGRQTLSMIWDAPEVNPFAGAGGDWQGVVEGAVKVVGRLPKDADGTAFQRDAGDPEPLARSSLAVSTDPPYYDNVAYADLSDFSYYWLRQFLRARYPDLLGTIKTPKDAEIIADPFRRNGEGAARAFFMERMGEALRNVASESSPALPITLYYAFKQTEDEEAEGDEEDSDDEAADGPAVSTTTGWETFLEAALSAGLSVTATWPMRTEGKTRLRGQNSNALASSIVLCCRHRAASAPTVSRRDFLRSLSESLPAAIAEMTSDPAAAVAPVDLQQAAIGPGMAVFSRNAAVLEADGTPMSVHNALVHINKAIDDYFSQAEGELDADTRFCIGWFHQYGFETGDFGDADVLARAKGTSVDGVKEAGVINASRGKVRLLKIGELPKAWDPTKDLRIPIWEACHQMCRALEDSEGDAGALLARMPEKQESVRLLAYRLFTLCERNGWAELARSYNALIASWPAIVEASQRAGLKGTQMKLI